VLIGSGLCQSVWELDAVFYAMVFVY